jgi:hypothetical protein
MEWVASTLYTTSERGVSSITTADAHTSAASSRLNWRPHRFKWTRPFRRKTKPVFCACAVTFQTQSTTQRWQSVGRSVGPTSRTKKHHKFVVFKIVGLILFKLDPKFGRQLWKGARINKIKHFYLVWWILVSVHSATGSYSQFVTSLLPLEIHL